jgi:ABC-type bacteriocin/lantibiotic exporter with double-glycine peptidase domain
MRWLIALASSTCRSSIAAMDSFHHVSALLVVAVVGWFELNGPTSVGRFLALSMWADAFLSQVCRVAVIADGMLNVRPDLARLKVLRGSVAEPRQAYSPRAEPIAVRFADVSFRYGVEEDWIIRGLSFSVAAGSVVVLKGTVGRGKTTLLRLIVGLLPANAGTVSIFGDEPSAARSDVIYLPQDVRVFSGTDEDNLLNYSRASPQRIDWAAGLTGLDEVLASFPKGMHTAVGPGGARLSPGQRQVLLLTAVVASEARLAVLDEPLANLDPKLRQRVFGPHLVQGKTVICVHHGKEDLARALAPVDVTELVL